MYTFFSHLAHCTDRLSWQGLCQPQPISGTGKCFIMEPFLLYTSLLFLCIIRTIWEEHFGDHNVAGAKSLAASIGPAGSGLRWGCPKGVLWRVVVEGWGRSGTMAGAAARGWRADAGGGCRRGRPRALSGGRQDGLQTVNFLQPVHRLVAQHLVHHVHAGGKGRGASIPITFTLTITARGQQAAPRPPWATRPHTAQTGKFCILWTLTVIIIIVITVVILIFPVLVWRFIPDGVKMLSKPCSKSFSRLGHWLLTDGLMTLITILFFLS